MTKNQNKRWYRIKSPFSYIIKWCIQIRSVNNIIITPAITGNDNSNNTAVIKTAQANKGIRSNNIPNTRKFPSVLIKFTAPRIELTPAKCNEKIAKSTELPACAIFLERGG